MKDFDVIIIGAGPAGSIAAEELVTKGWRVLLVDKNVSPGINKPCGGLLSYQAILDFNIDKAVIQKEIKKDIFYFPWGSKKKDVNNITVLRREFDKYLALRAAEKGVIFFPETKAFDVTVKDPGNVLVRVIRKNTEELADINCRIAIFADGVHTQASKCNIGFKRDNDNCAFALLYEVEAIDNMIDHCEIYFDSQLYRWGYGWMFPKKDLLNIGIGCIITELSKKKDIKSKLEAFAEKKLSHLKISRSRILRRKGGYIPLYLAKRLANHSSIAIGDAGGFVHSLFCAGIDPAMYSALAVSEVINDSLKKEKYDPHYINEIIPMLKKYRFFRFIKQQNLITRLFQPLSILNNDLFPRLMYTIIFGENFTRYNKLVSVFSTKYLKENLY